MSAVRIATTAVAFALMAGAGFFYISAGLVVPFPWLLGLQLVWLALLAVQIRWRRRTAVVLVAPFAAAAFLFAAVSLGEQLLGWTG